MPLTILFEEWAALRGSPCFQRPFIEMWLPLRSCAEANPVASEPIGTNAVAFSYSVLSFKASSLHPFSDTLIAMTKVYFLFQNEGIHLVLFLRKPEKGPQLNSSHSPAPRTTIGVWG